VREIIEVSGRAAARMPGAEFSNLNWSKEARMSDWPKDEEGVLFFRTRQVAEAAAAKCNAAKLEPEGEVARS
jgi:hypothetical protein